MKVVAVTLIALLGACSRSSEPTSVTPFKGGPPAREVVVVPALATLRVGDTLRFTVPGSSPGQHKWHSRSVAVATVDSLTGLVLARAQGTAVIVAVAAADSNLSGAAGLVVNP